MRGTLALQIPRDIRYKPEPRGPASAEGPIPGWGEEGQDMSPARARTKKCAATPPPRGAPVAGPSPALPTPQTVLTCEPQRPPASPAPASSPPCYRRAPPQLQQQPVFARKVAHVIRQPGKRQKKQGVMTSASPCVERARRGQVGGSRAHDARRPRPQRQWGRANDAGGAGPAELCVAGFPPSPPLSAVWELKLRVRATRTRPSCWLRDQAVL